MTDVMILAAGLGTRMKSRRAKVLHELAGRPLIAHVIRAAFALHPASLITIIGHQADEVERAARQAVAQLVDDGNLTPPELFFAVQTEQKGTGHAVMAAREVLQSRTAPLIVTAGDVPMMQGAMLKRLLETHNQEHNDATVLTVKMDEPFGYGRIIRDAEGRYLRCVEQKDGTPEELAVKEINVSIYCFNPASLLGALAHLKADNAQQEFYLTDVPEILLRQGQRLGVFCYEHTEEVRGINTRVELAELERQLRDQKLRELMLAGVTIVDPATTYIHQDVVIGPDTIIHPQVIIEGASRIGAGCVIHSWSRLTNVQMDDDVRVNNSCIIENTTLHSGSSIGPFARLRMNAEIGENAVIGNFVEVKKSKIGKDTKAQHLTYLGDATLGEKVNIGAGTITCNFDGVRKHETIIEDNVKIGSDTMLVAPVRVGKGSVTGAGTVVTKDVPPDSLVVGVPAVVKKKFR
ncbi:MAG: bifunctional UDP-N-acetylglucosamine diphosphorylase/glucosamine-1-phosphate N-acetyltransferase GlmU [Acidobacteria bacterium]|nr:bifunctional UDP-N-acetylglucosamine diphosphorylase/glucosamine-1-phosphate N-acetyltransferase GlmU [Acidobacteriota bacterium]